MLRCLQRCKVSYRMKKSSRLRKHSRRWIISIKIVVLIWSLDWMLGLFSSWCVKQQVSLHILFGFLRLIGRRMQHFKKQISKIMSGNSVYSQTCIKRTNFRFGRTVRNGSLLLATPADWNKRFPTTGLTGLSGVWIAFPRTETIRSHTIESRNPVQSQSSLQMISDSVELCETEVCFLHIQLTGIKVRHPKNTRRLLKLISNLQDLPRSQSLETVPICNAVLCFPHDNTVENRLCDEHKKSILPVVCHMFGSIFD